jgi:hypothetical protein
MPEWTDPQLWLIIAIMIVIIVFLGIYIRGIIGRGR